jgi:hypothetical protein
VVATEWALLWHGLAPSYPDMVHYFYPLNNLTGRLLRAGELPVWSPYQMSGMPLMGDPQAGWGSVVSMLSFALLPLERAAGVTLALKMALASVGTLLLLRSTGVGAVGAALGGLAYGLSVQAHEPSLNMAYGNFAYVGSYAWLPWLLLGADIAVRGHGRRRLLGWGLVAVAASQAVSVWLGQGAYYSFAAAGAYVAYLTLLGEPAQGKGAWARLREFGLHAIVLSALSVGLSAWTLFPRLELLLVSNLSGGYAVGEEQIAGGVSFQHLWIYLDSGAGYVGAIVWLLVLAAPFLRPTRAQVFYGAMTVLLYLSSLRWLVEAAKTNPAARGLFDLIPGALELHLHHPQRVHFVFVFFAALLAGATVDRLVAATRRRRLALAGATLGALAILFTTGRYIPHGFGDWRAFLLGLALALLIVAGGWALRARGALIGALLVALTAGELIHSVAVGHESKLTLERVERRYSGPDIVPSVAALRGAVERGRYFGYEPNTLRGAYAAYRNLRASPRNRSLLVTTEATVHRLEDAQGYNPLHLDRYDTLLRVANGRRQNYRNAYIWPRALNSPLLDMLNIRYLLTHPGTRLGAKYEPRATLQGATLWENTRALPRAWAVHETRVGNDLAALRLIDRGGADPRRIALVPRPVKGLSPARGPERVSVDEYRQGSIRLTADLSAPALVILSELDYPAWKVWVDGQRRPAVRANGLLRAVQVPAGRHTVEWRYSSTPTNLGFALSALTALGLVGAIAFWPRLARRRRVGPR